MIDYAKSKDEAIRRFNKYGSLDPFPNINPALLNSSDIRDYVAATGMIYPFRDDDKYFKPASYGLCLSGKYIYWDEKGREQKGTLNKGDTLILKQNSIAFVSLKPLLQLPDYIAARFNLKIDNIYKGLLLGTGPLVDPGFIGYLSFPLHNLTTNEYHFAWDEEIVWMEFTKLSENERWLNKSNLTRKGRYKENRKFTHDDIKDVEYFLYEAERHRAVRSSIPELFETSKREAEKAAESAKEAQKSAEGLKTRFNWTVGISLVAIFVGVIFVIIQVILIKNATVNFVSEAEKRQQELHLKLTEEIVPLKPKIDSLEKQIKNLQEIKTETK